MTKSFKARPGGANTSRRHFLGGMAALTLAVGFNGGIALAADAAGEPPLFVPNAFIRVGADSRITVISSYLEMGQGTFTGLATMAADELDVGLDKVQVEPAPLDVALYLNPVMAKKGVRVQGTGASSAMAGAWFQMRQAAAAAREMLLAAAARQWHVEPAALTVEDGVIVHAASGRQGGYGEFVAEAARMPVPAHPQVKTPAEFRLIGQPGTRRLDVPAKVNGSAIYTQDIKLPGMLVAVIAHPPKLWAKPARIDASKAKAIPGVVAVVEVPGDHQVLGGVAVLAKNTWIARQGRDALQIEWDDSTALTLGSEDIAQQYLTLAQQPGVVAAQRGQVLTQAPAGGKLIEEVFELPYLAHAAMEPMNCAVHLQDGRCDVWNGIQYQTFDQNYLAKDLGLKPEQIFATQLYAGGSFGRRASPHSDYVREAARIAKAAAAQGLNVPVKLVWMREDDMRAGYYRPLTVHKVSLVVDGAGKLVSWRQTIVGQSFLPQRSPNTVDPLLVGGASDMPYDIPNLLVEAHRPENIAVTTSWLRSVSHSHTAVVGELLINEAALAAGQDPYQFRRAMLRDNPRCLGVLDLVAEKAGWGEALAPGMAGEKRARGIAFQLSLGTYVAQVAEVTVRADGSYAVDRVVLAVDCGTNVNPDIVAAQMEGAIGFGMSFLRQTITIQGGRVQQGNFNDYPVLRMNAMPRAEVHIVPSHALPSGVGEPGVPPTAPAVLNALTAATGMTFRTLPLGDVVRLS